MYPASTTAQPTLNIGNQLEAHTPEFACAAGSPYGLDQAIKGAKIMAVVACVMRNH